MYSGKKRREDIISKERQKENAFGHSVDGVEFGLYGYIQIYNMSCHFPEISAGMGICYREERKDPSHPVHSPLI